MEFLSLNEIKSQVNNLVVLIDAPKEELPTYGYSKDFAYPHIEVDQKGYHYVIVERGKEIKRLTTTEIHQLLYFIFESVTSSMAVEYELKNRQNDKDSRRISFRIQEELLYVLNPKWSEIQKNKHKQILQKHPFDDLAGLRATYSEKLRDNGIKEKEIKKLSLKKYPI